MPKFRFLCSQNSVAAIKVGTSLYYIDVLDSHNIKVYDSELNRLKIIVPEFWLPEITRGEITFQVLKYASQAFEQGFVMASARKRVDFFYKFCDEFDFKIRDFSSRSKLTDIYWVEFYPYDKVKQMVSFLVADDKILRKDLESSSNIIHRAMSRADSQDDLEFSRQLSSVFENLKTELNCKTVNHLAVLMNTDVAKTSHLFDNISTIITLR